MGEFPSRWWNININHIKSSRPVLRKSNFLSRRIDAVFFESFKLNDCFQILYWSFVVLTFDLMVFGIRKIRIKHNRTLLIHNVS